MLFRNMELLCYISPAFLICRPIQNTPRKWLMVDWRSLPIQLNVGIFFQLHQTDVVLPMKPLNLKKPRLPDLEYLFVLLRSLHSLRNYNFLYNYLCDYIN